MPITGSASQETPSRVDLESGSANTDPESASRTNIFYKKICGPYSLCCNYWTLLHTLLGGLFFFFFFLQPFKNCFFLKDYAYTGSRLRPAGYSLPSDAHKQVGPRNTSHSATHTITLPTSEDGSYTSLGLFFSCLGFCPGGS